MNINTKIIITSYISYRKKRFFLAEEAPICQGKLRGDFGYCAISPTAKAVLDGTYDYPDDFHEATRELCEECARIMLTVPSRSVSSLITRERLKGVRQEKKPPHQSPGCTWDTTKPVHSVQ